MADDGKMYDSGARVSAEALRFDLVPRVFTERVAKRYGDGAKRYGDSNYQLGLRDRAYIIERMNHLAAHLQAYLHPKNTQEIEDDNLAAIAWGSAFLMEVESDAVGKQILAGIRGLNESAPRHPGPYLVSSSTPEGRSGSR